MAIFTPGVAVGQISGRVGGSVFSRNRGGSYIRNGSVPVSVQSEKALAYKGYLSYASQLWASETAANRQAWTSFAQTKTVTNRLGKSISLTAQNWYVKLNSRLLAAGASPIEIPPADAPPGTPVISGFTVDAGAGSTELTFTPTPLPTDISLWVRGAKVQSSTIINVENLLTTLIISPSAQASPLDLEDELIEAFGVLQVGATYVIEARALDTATGYVSGKVFARTVAVST